jgi:hypothetical protein
MKIVNGIIFLWSGTNASIPSGWSRVTSMDDNFPKGTANATNPDTTGGAATHTHTSPTHTHTAQSHTHTITVGAGTGSALNTSGGGSSPLGYHAHAPFTSGAIASFSASSDAATYAAYSNNPPFYKTIYVTPTVQVSYFPSSLIGLSDAAITGFNICDGTNSTPNLVDKYLLGASAGADAGTTGGSTTNVHDITHTHTTSHSHAAATSGNADNITRSFNAGSTTGTNHTHSVTPNAATPNISFSGTLTTSETVEPAHTKLIAIQASVNKLIPLGIIGMWKGLLSAIPSGWILCDGTGGTVDMRNRHLKITGTVGGVGTTGGSNTHTHASQNHTHDAASHSHTVANLGHSMSATRDGSSGQASAVTSGVVHAVSTDSINLVTDAGATTADSSNNEPAYRTVAFIKLNQRTSTSPFIFNFLSGIKL